MCHRPLLAIVFTTCLFSLILTGCSNVRPEQPQAFGDVVLTTEPPGAEVWVPKGGELVKVGETPLTVRAGYAQQHYYDGAFRREVWLYSPPEFPLFEQRNNCAWLVCTLKREGWKEQKVNLLVAEQRQFPLDSVPPPFTLPRELKVWMSEPAGPRACYYLNIDSIPSGAEVYSLTDSGQFGRSLGTTPLRFRVGISQSLDPLTGHHRGWNVWAWGVKASDFYSTESDPGGQARVYARYALYRDRYDTTEVRREPIALLTPGQPFPSQDQFVTTRMIPVAQTADSPRGVSGGPTIDGGSSSFPPGAQSHPNRAAEAGQAQPATVTVTFKEFSQNREYPDWTSKQLLGDLTAYRLRIFPKAFMTPHFAALKNDAQKRHLNLPEAFVIDVDHKWYLTEIEDDRMLMKKETLARITEILGGGHAIFYTIPVKSLDKNNQVRIPLPPGTYYIEYSLVFGNAKHAERQYVHPNYVGLGRADEWGPARLIVEEGKPADITFAPSENAAPFSYDPSNFVRDSQAFVHFKKLLFRLGYGD